MGSITRIIKKNPLLVSSFNLMAATGVAAIFGFLFWILVAHSFLPNSIGLATTLLSVSGLISLFGLAGFDTVFVRFLAKSKKRNEQINSGMLIAAVVSGLLAIIFCCLVSFISPKLSFVNTNLLYSLSFVTFTIFTTWNTLTNAILVAYRRTSYVLYINIVFSIAKIGLIFVAHKGGPMTIFVVVGIAQVINVLISIALLSKYFEYVPSIKINFDILKETLRYNLANYVASILNLIPDSALPIIIINRLGATEAAYFYIAFTIANLLYTIAFSTSQALLAEASFDSQDVMTHLRNGVKIVSSFMIPAVVFLIIFCPLILNIFGHNYGNGATSILRIFAVSGLLVMCYSLLNFIFKQTKYMKAIICMTLVNAVVIIALSLILVGKYGLVGIGWAWFIGTLAAVCVGASFVINEKKISK